MRSALIYKMVLIRHLHISPLVQKLNGGYL